ncbi:hypothetical protein BJ138DRAFT_242109 [Hygrophoropsis aurantiaca]|uniref:Uncharacterized protein n=1 Tax=Hygrophoropsis aurantiaca TaxID=72124 RepID=A0ACB8AP48_9AGAM|nr:hypothetical protein BJ138DRAFT_242109 [Hygrophoropsis aurantiaca]
MSSRHDYRRRDRSWEREDRDRDRGGDRYSRSSRAGPPRDSGRKRDSRSRSPRRDRRDYGRERDRTYKDEKRDDRREYDRDGRRTERNDSKDAIRDERKDIKQDTSTHSGYRERDAIEKDYRRDIPHKMGPSAGSRSSEKPGEEAMDATNADDDAMMVAMGLAGFGSTKGKHVEGNQEGGVNIKKMRTWRQYMNRRGGFNRPLDKIK